MKVRFTSCTGHAKDVLYDPEDFDGWSSEEINDALQDDAWQWAVENWFWVEAKVLDLNPVEKGL